ncbi:APL4 [Candida oxycetoniae]|uniref:AP-1 complex subunit gamma n=1 Tax=Candida oxycetoniae TaxID=497107 RepID=A0AAI9WXX0_9ASCO|nr:APL4 [Candida oxycetoniae]KAI3404439.2 APL4 [Candida oxycetoniae]
MGSLKSFIKAVRKAKTIADERAVIQKESASIRTSFRDLSLDQTTRRINISKLLYLYIMGEKTHFGQVECLKLLASPRFADKRLGYLACMLILDENQEVLTLLTNSLDNDMQHPNSYIVGLALCCLGNIASPELARDLYTNVETIMDTKNNFLKKKACFVAAKLVEKEPELSEFFLPRALDLINEKNSSVLLGTLRLIEALCKVSEENKASLVITIPKIVNHLKRITTSGYQPDYDVMGTTDPFLQVSLLSTIRTLAVGQQYTEEVNDILTQVASNLDSGKNAAHAILYECVKTIFAIDSDQSLKILGVNLLGKFLSTRDNNTRYVALDTLLKIVNIEPLAVQRHRTIIVNCLTDEDISIRRRALELSFGIINEQNIRVMAREILSFLENCTNQELKSYVTSQLTIAVSKYSPNEKWRFDTLVRTLKAGGNCVTPDIISNILASILQCSDQELKKHIVAKLLAACLEDGDQYGLALITTWTLGEYGDIILGTQVEVKGKSITVEESVISDLFDTLLVNSIYTDQELVQLTAFILTATLKLSIKFKNPKVIEHLRQIINSKTYDSNLEIQIRAVEYQEIFGQDAVLKRGLLARMPPPPIKERESLTLHKSNTNTYSTNSTTTAQVNRGNSAFLKGAASRQDNLLLDLFNTEDDGPKTTTQNDVLSDIFGNSSGSSSSTAATTTTTATSTTVPSSSAINVFENSNIKVVFVPRDFAGNGEATIEAVVTSNNSHSKIEQVQLLIAVPKTQKLNITSTSGKGFLVYGKDQINQILKIVGRPGAKLKLRVKLKYKIDGVPTEDQFDFAGFEKTL